MAASVFQTANTYVSHGRRDDTQLGLLSPASSSDAEDYMPPSMNKDHLTLGGTRWILRTGFALLPSFIQKRIRPSLNKPRRLHPTSWLDGLRGVAAFIVFVCHFTEANMGWFTESYGVNETGVKSAFVQLPILRVIYSGRPMVHIFFVISGYVLSFKPLKLIRSRNYKNLATTLSSSVFRRGFRLFLPTTVSTFIMFLIIRLGWAGTPYDTWWEQFMDWMDAVWQITYSWRWDLIQGIPYDAHLWTIPIEMSFSMLLFITIIGVARCKTWLRLSIVFLLMNYCMKARHWAGTEFLGGMLIAEITLIQEEAKAASEAHKEQTRSYDSKPHLFMMISKLVAQGLLVAALLFGLFLAGWPNGSANRTPGIKWFYAHSPEPFWSAGGDLIPYPWFSLAAILIVFSLQNLPFLNQIFASSFCQYLGCISYSLYMMHGPVLDVFGPHIIDYMWGITCAPDEATTSQRLFVWVGGNLLLLIPTIWSADLFWRQVDQPLVEFSRWLENVCIVPDHDGILLR